MTAEVAGGGDEEAQLTTAVHYKRDTGLLVDSPS